MPSDTIDRLSFLSLLEIHMKFRSTFLRTALCAALIATATTSVASAAQDKTRDRISAKVMSMMGVKPDSVQPAPVKGLYEVVINRTRLFYVDADVKHLIAGRIFDAATETDLTAQRVEALSRIDWKELPLKDAIKVVYGKGERKIAVFTDAKCTYCRILERSLKEVGNVTVYNFMYPILNSREMAQNIVCAQDPAMTFQQHMLEGKDPAVNRCATEVLDRNLALGQQFGITGTPAIIFADGSKFAGAMPVDRLKQALDTIK